MLFTTESSFHALLTRVELLYTNMHPVGLLDGAVSHYTFRLEIYGTTSICFTNFTFHGSPAESNFTISSLYSNLTFKM